MKSLQNNYNLIKEGKGNKELFLKQAKREFPQHVTNVLTFDQAVSNLKERGIITENISNDITSKNTEPNWFKIFNSNLTEAKATEKKTSKEVTDLEEKNFDYKDDKNMDNVIGAELLKGFYVEMKDPKNVDKTVEEVKELVTKNLAKDPLYYVKDGQFGIKGLGYTEAEQKEAKGKYKASGYGDITEGTVKETSINENQVKVITTKWPYVEFKDGETVHKVEFDYGDMIDDHGNEGQDQYWVGEDENGQEWEVDVYADYRGEVQDIHYDTITRV